MSEKIIQSTSDNLAYFDTVAEAWDELRTEFFPISLRETAVARSGISAGHSAADIGAGSGFVSEGLLNIGARVVAVDHSDGMIAQLEKRFGENERFWAKKGESEKLPLGDDVFDFAFANMYLHHVESPKNSIREMVRILKPGGMLVITDLDTHRFEFLVREHFDRWMGFERAHIHHLLSEAGLKNVDVTCAGERCTANAEMGDDSAAVSIFLAIGEKAK